MAAASEAIGRPFMPHQRLIVDVFLEVQSEAAGDPEPGEWAYDDGLATMQRRGGKTAIQSPLVTHRARLVRGAQMFMTAQNRNKARRRWLDITEDLLRSPLARDVRRKVSISHEELRWLDGGASLIPFAPTEDEMHSETPDLVLIDEQWAFDQAQAKVVQAGYVPAFATSSGQAFKLSTAGTDRSWWLNEDRKAGRRAVEAGVRLGTCYFEWSLPDRVGGVRVSDLDDEALVEACVAHHPAVCHVPGCVGPRAKRPCVHGFTVRPAAIRTARTKMDRSEFVRAYGNRSAEDLAAKWQALDESVWVGQAEPAGAGIPASVSVAFGVWVDEDGKDAAVSAGWRGPDGAMHVEVIADERGPALRDGVRWVLPFVQARQTRPLTVAVLNTGPARDVADELDAAGVEVLRVSQADGAAAVARHVSELSAGSCWHRRSLEADAAAAAVARKSSAGRLWERPDVDSIAAVGSHTLAGWAFDHAPTPVVRRPFKVR